MVESIEEKREFIIRNVRSDDIDAIIKVNRFTLPENYPYYFFVEHVRDWGEAFFVAVVDGEVVGYIMPRIETGFSNLRNFIPLVRKGHVVSIAVLEQYRRRGIGRQLLTSSMQKMREAYGAEEVYLEVRVSNVPAISLYEKLGYKKVRLLKHYYADGEDAYLMAAPLQ
ncbi:ribosomal protein S18-alanine N-acetyltransferase [Metallosphaera tengchongensis]|uniref:N-alpha-acetyltransferase n=1 Tax=Metallosphaera tengchongensis TaxID=1532350 RepID=A0A6N0NXV6_9CREN|nr:ribosomal protein S18-alanine N-acetyltransferase [Metallosphaera tengchongensis]QKQ99950.1 ribosomal protein S18-alanine N-acetyltransferase [Metallosphaera tengchongensis]